MVSVKRERRTRSAAIEDPSRGRIDDFHTPSLREVSEDISVLADHFLSKYCKMMNTEPKQFTPGALEVLANYSWPGNTRQLENEVKRLVASVRGKSITEDYLDHSIRNLSASGQSLRPKEEPAPKSPASRSLPDAVERLERRLIEEALENSGGNKQKAAQVLGLSPPGVDQEVEAILYSSMSYHRLTR